MTTVFERSLTEAFESLSNGRISGTLRGLLPPAGATSRGSTYLRGMDPATQRSLLSAAAVQQVRGLTPQQGQIAAQLTQAEQRVQSLQGALRGVSRGSQRFAGTPIYGYQRNAYRFPNLGPDERLSGSAFARSEGVSGSGLQIWAKPLRNNQLGEKQFDLNVARLSGKGGLGEFNRAFDDFFKTAEAGTYQFTGLTDRLNRIYQRLLESNRIPYRVNPHSNVMSVRAPLRNPILTPSSDTGTFVPPMAGPLKPRTLADRYRAGSIGPFTGSALPPGYVSRHSTAAGGLFGIGGGPRRPVQGPIQGPALPPMQGPALPPNSFKKQKDDVESLAGSLGRLAVAYGGLEAIRFVFDKTAEIERQTKSIEVLTGSLSKTKEIIGELQKFANVTPFTSSELIDTAKRLKAFGVGTEDLVATVKRLGDVSGATGADLVGLTTAYGQVMAKGRLQGEELLQFQERGIALQPELQRMYKMTGEQFADAMKDGQISSEAVVVALKNLTSVGGRYANGAIAQSNTLGGKFSTLMDAVEALARAIGTALSPALVEVLGDITSMVNSFVNGLAAMQANYTSFLNSLRGSSATELQGQISQIDTWIKSNQDQLKNTRGGSANEESIQNKIKELRALRASLQTDLDKKLGLVAPTWQPVQLPPNNATPPLLRGNGGGGGGGGGGRRAEFQLSSQGQALVNAAKELGISPLDLATIIGFETGGTYSPRQWGGAGGQYMGLIQFGPGERRQYGAHQGQSFEEQVQGPVVRYFKDRFAGVGMSTQGADLLTLYRTVLGGNPKANINGQDAFGTSPASGVAAMGPHRQTALNRFFGGSMENVGWSAADAGAAAAQGWEDIQKQAEIAAELKADAEERLKIAQAQLAIEKALNPLQELQLQAAERKRLIEGEYAELIKTASEEATKKTLEDAKKIELQLEEVKLEKELKELRANAVSSIQEEIAQLQAKLAGKEKEYAIEKAIADLKKGGVSDAEARGLVLQRQQLTEQSAAQDQVRSDAEGISSTITGGIKEAIKAAVTGGDVKAALSNMLGSLGEKFLDMAMRPLEDMLTKSLTNMLNPQQLATQANTAALWQLNGTLQSAALTGGAGGGFGGAGGILGGLGSLFGGGGGFAGAFSSSFGSSWGGFAGALNMPLLMADGGFVTGPTPAVVGEGGANEYVIPENKMGSAMQRWNAGARGSAVVDGADATGSGGGGSEGYGPAKLDISYSAVRIDNIDYINSSQFQAGIAQAAQQGAKQGEARALARLRNSPGTRRKVGM